MDGFCTLNQMFNASALSFASTSQSTPSFNEGIDVKVAFRFKSSLFIRHHCLLERGNDANFIFNASTYLSRSSKRICVHSAWTSLNASVPSAAFFLQMLARQRSFNQGCELFLHVMTFCVICFRSKFHRISINTIRASSPVPRCKIDQSTF